MPAHTLSKQLYILALFLLCVSCRQGQSQEFNTQTLNLKGDIKHIMEITGKGTWDLEFADNQLLYVTQKMGSELTRYDFHYESKKLVRITSGRYDITPELFTDNFAMRMPLYGFHGADSLIRNKFGDVVQVFFKNQEPQAYRINYTYDEYNNWLSWELYTAGSDFPQERAERTIVYNRMVTAEEISAWHARLDSIYKEASNRNALIASIDNNIEGNKSKLKQINLHLNEKYDDVKSIEATVKALTEIFASKYGTQNFSPALNVVYEKLQVLRIITQRESSLWHEARLYIQLLMNGKKSVKDRQEPFDNRYTLTYSLEIIDEIRRSESKYETLRSRP
jgi:hypothetical protein